jgi:elongation factor G
MEKPAAPWPLLQIAIEPKLRADKEKLRVALAKLADEDSGLNVTWDQESGQTIIAFMTEVDLEIIVDRLRGEFAVDVNVGAPQVAYRETITRTHEQDYTHERQFAGHGQFARVKIMFEPNGYNPDFAFVSRVIGGAFPGDYAAGVEKGVRTTLVSGPFAGFPMIGVKATLVDAACHETDSSASAFEIASRASFKEAASKLGVQLLEPIMRVEVVTPHDYVRAIVSELKSRRAKFESEESRGADVVVAALVPLANMFKLEDTLRSRSQGQARLTVSYCKYVPLPDDDDDPPAAAMALARR